MALVYAPVAFTLEQYFAKKQIFAQQFAVSRVTSVIFHDGGLKDSAKVFAKNVYRYFFLSLSLIHSLTHAIKNV